ncbi:MAG: HD domain-containing protein [Treponema sp.]|nr:HD domain-containing protein [Treponema sp.]
MLSRKDFKTFLFVAICIFLNLAGKNLALFFKLPVWFDSFGTVISAYSLGPLCASIIALTSNILFNDFAPITFILTLPGLAIAIITGILARKKWFESLFKTMSANIIVTFTTVSIVFISSWLLEKGMTKNIWGDGVIKYLEQQGMPEMLSSFLGFWYVDFLDKTIIFVSLYINIKIWRKREKVKNLIKTTNVLPLLFLSLLFFNGGEAFSQKAGNHFNSYVQTIYSSDNKLPCGEANDIAQTPDGILWIGTYAGLYRFNGTDFKQMTDFESVRNANCLFVDEEGRLWIGTNDNGLSICINGKIVTTLDNTKGLPSNSVRAIVKGADGYYYVGTSIGILVLELNNGLRICNIIKDVGYTVGLSADKSGYVSAVTSNGQLYILNESEIRYSQSLNTDKEIFTCCAFSPDGTLYAGTSKNNIYLYSISDEKAQLKDIRSTYSLNHVNDIYFYQKRIFLCTDNGIGYFTLDSSFKLIQTGSFNNSIDNMTVDYQGNFWFTSSRQGLLRLSASSFINLYKFLGIKSKVVNTVHKWQDSIYVGSDMGLDIIQDSRLIKNQLTSMLEDVRIRCIFKDSKNTLWICSYGKGLLSVSPQGNIKIFDSSTNQIGNRVRLVIESRDGRILAASEKGITYIKDGQIQQNLSYTSNQNNAKILSLMEMNDGTILAGTDGDGLVLIKGDQVSKLLGIADGLTSGVILRTVPQPNGNGAYIVTSNSICFLSGYLKVHTIKKFPYFNNYDILANKDGHLFILGSAGIHVVNNSDLLSDSTELQYDLLDAKSGLDSSLTANAWNYCDEEGNLYLSTGTGVYIVNMDNYIFGNQTYHMKVSSVNLDSKNYPIERGEPLVIDRDVKKIEFFPELVNFTVRDPTIGYWLEGFDFSETRIPQSQLTSVTYTNLPAGSYKFHISVYDKRENVIEHSSYEIYKEKKIYDTTYFKIYMLVVSIIAIAWFTWFFLRIQLQHRLEMQKKQLELAKDQVRMGNETILAIAKTVDAKDENTSQHSVRVSEYSVLIAGELGFTKEEQENIRRAALLHDIGKIGIPDRILNKPGRLTDEEYAVMKSHVTRGAEILKDFTIIDHVQDGVLYHHEKYDGSGYPQGLKGDDIPLYGRIIGVADAFDAMTANRVYRKKLDFEYVLEELRRCRGSQFDPKIADIMLKIVSEGKINIQELYSHPQKLSEKD